MVTSDDHELDELIGAEDDPFATGWWVGADGNWYPPDEPFSAGRSRSPSGLRRVVIAMLAVAIAAATTLSVLAGGRPLSSDAPTSPTVAQLTAQARQVVVGSGTDDLHLGGVTSVICHSPSSWSSGQTFECDVFGSSQTKIGEYVGTVEPGTSDGEWRWNGGWKPRHPSTVA